MNNYIVYVVAGVIGLLFVGLMSRSDGREMLRKILTGLADLFEVRSRHPNVLQVVYAGVLWAMLWNHIPRPAFLFTAYTSQPGAVNIDIVLQFEALLIGVGGSFLAFELMGLRRRMRAHDNSALVSFMEALVLIPGGAFLIHNGMSAGADTLFVVDIFDYQLLIYIGLNVFEVAIAPAQKWMRSRSPK